MVNYDKIFQLHEGCSKKPFRGRIENHDLARPDISRGEKQLKDIVAVKHSMGGQTLYDIVWTTNAHPLIVSDRIVNLFKTNGITGWNTYDVELYSKKNKLLGHKYHGLIITGRCGYRDYSKSSIVLDKIGVSLEPHIKGFYFHQDYWDGSDLFMSHPFESGKTTMYRFCTEKVVKLFKKEKIKSILFDRLSDLTLPIELFNVPLTQKQASEVEKLQSGS